MTGRPALLLLQLAALAVSVGANEGSVTGSCHCDQRIPSSTPPKPELMEHFRKQLRAYHRCPAYIRFRLHSRSVCGGSRDPWVHELLRCFDGGECGHAHRESLAHRKPLPSRSTEIPKSTEEASAHLPSTAQTHLPTTLPPGAQGNETTTAPLSQSPEVGPEAGQNQKQLEEIVGPAAGTSATVPVLTLLAITFLLTGVLAYVLCKRRRERSLKCSPALCYGLGKQWKMAQALGPLHPYGRPGRSPWLLALDRPTSGYCSHLGSEPADGRPFSVSPSRCL